MSTLATTIPANPMPNATALNLRWAVDQVRNIMSRVSESGDAALIRDVSETGEKVCLVLCGLIDTTPHTERCTHD